MSVREIGQYLGHVGPQQPKYPLLRKNEPQIVVVAHTLVSLIEYVVHVEQTAWFADERERQAGILAVDRFTLPHELPPGMSASTLCAPGQVSSVKKRVRLTGSGNLKRGQVSVTCNTHKFSTLTAVDQHPSVHPQGPVCFSHRGQLNVKRTRLCFVNLGGAYF